MTRYRKRLVEVEAWQVGSDDPKPEWVRGYLAAHPHMEDRFAGMGPWLVLGRIGIVTLYTRHQFEDEYELVPGIEAGLAIEDLIRKIEADGVDAVNLKPCPFHEDPVYPKAYVRHDKGNGHPDSGGWSATVECPDCGASMSESECVTAGDALEGAAEAWNTRFMASPDRHACHDCGTRLNTNWGWCEGCGEWREA